MWMRFYSVFFFVSSIIPLLGLCSIIFDRLAKNGRIYEEATTRHLNEYSLQDLLGVASNASVDSSSVQFGLTSLQNLLTSSLNLASIFSTKVQPLPLYECFSVSFASESNILQLYFWSYGLKIGGKGSAFWDSPANATAITAGDFAHVSHLSEPVDRVLPRRCESDLQVSRSRN